jgi:hypothetical protein
VLDAALVKEDRAAQQDTTTDISIEVLDESLPHRLRLNIAQQLQQAQHAGKARGSGLAATFEVCQLPPEPCNQIGLVSQSTACVTACS